MSKNRTARQKAARPAPARLITLDMDGTVYDPWACCGKPDHSNLGTAACRHPRLDTFKTVLQLQAETGADIVVLSYRSRGEVEETRQWLSGFNVFPTAIYHIDSPDHRTLLNAVRSDPSDRGTGDGQVTYKRGVVRRLLALGHEIVGAFDDNTGVIKAISALGVLATRIEYLVEISDADFRAAGRKDRYNSDRQRWKDKNFTRHYSHGQGQLDLQPSLSREQAHEMTRNLSRRQSAQEGPV